MSAHRTLPAQWANQPRFAERLAPKFWSSDPEVTDRRSPLAEPQDGPAGGGRLTGGGEGGGRRLSSAKLLGFQPLQDLVNSDEAQGAVLGLHVLVPHPVGAVGQHEAVQVQVRHLSHEIALFSLYFPNFNPSNSSI